MQLKRYLHSSAKSFTTKSFTAKGFTVLELLVAASIGLLLTGLTVGATLSNRNIFQNDLSRTRLNQNLRGAMDVVGVNIREAGENLSASFPAVDIIDGGGTVPDELVLRRNLRDEVLKVCTSIVAGTGVDQIYFALTGTVSGCTYSSNQFNFTSWKSYRTTEGGEVRAYIFDQVTKAGEFFNYVNEVDDGTQLYIESDGTTWANSYSNTSSSVFLIEEWHFRLDQLVAGDWVLQLVENDDENNPMNIIYGITNFQIQVVKPDNTIQDTLLVTDTWTGIKALQVTLTGQDEALNTPITRSLTSRFFPRNILSN